MIASRYRRKGYGAEAFKRIVEIGRSHGFHKFITSTDLTNTAMRSHLEKAGFSNDNEIRDGEIVYYLEDDQIRSTEE